MKGEGLQRRQDLALLADASLIGASVLRKEDDRFLRGLGRYLADVALADVREVAFVRSPVAHGLLKQVGRGEGVWTAAELAPIARPMLGALLRDAFRKAPYPALAIDRVRFVGQPIAAVVAANRNAALDLAESVALDIDELPALVDALDALAPGAPKLNDDWADNVILRLARATDGFDAAATRAPVTIERHYRMARAAPAPIETRGVIAWMDRRNDQLVVWTSTQRPHLIRSFLARHLVGFDERRVRVIVPDVGGAFGGKTNFYPEELALAAIATQVPHAVRWIETRSEHLLASCHAREQIQTLRVHAERDGTIVALDARIVGDGGAYSMITSTGAIEANMAASVLLGPYAIRNYRFEALSVVTNKTPMGPYRGVGRPGAVFGMERTIDELAHALGLEPNAVRARNLIANDAFPYRTATALVYDSGDYAGLVAKAEAAIGHPAIRAEQHAQSPASRTRIGLGYAMYVEQTAHGAAEFVARGSPVLYGFESARVRLDLTGKLTVEVAVLSQGQALETTLAQIAAAVTGVPLDDVTVRQGDTDQTPYGMGTVASRSIVKAGGATYHACRKLAAKLRVIAAARLECSVDAVQLAQGRAHAGPPDARGRSLAFADIADCALQNVQHLPAGVEPGLEVVHFYRPEIETGTFASGMHAAKVAVDLDTGVVRLLDYLVVEDCGQEINPMVVEGQVHGGVAQGIGQALFEAFRYDASGQLLAGTFMDYAMPTAAEVPPIRIEHQHTLSAFGVFGMKGTGEGGGIGPPAAIANAVSDALAQWNIGVADAPLSAPAIWRAIERAAKSSSERTYITTEKHR